MSKHDDEEWVLEHGFTTCPDCGKNRYVTRKVALLIRKRDPSRKYRAYRCGDYWHVTSQPTAKVTKFRKWQR